MKSYSQHKSQRQERRVAQELSGRVQPASGAMDHAKSDVRDMGNIRVECKTTQARSYSLKLDDLIKIQSEALQGGLEAPVMAIEFQGQLGMSRRYAVIDWNWFLEMYTGGNT